MAKTAGGIRGNGGGILSRHGDVADWHRGEMRASIMRNDTMWNGPRYIAVTPATSKVLKTQQGAERWLEQLGYSRGRARRR